MNRKERRMMQKNLQKSGMSHEEAQKYVKDNYTDIEYKEGQICRLNYGLIVNHPDYKNQPEEFKAWIESHKDTILTIEHADPPANGATTKKVMLVFKEDLTNPKWYIHSDAIIPLAQAKVKLNSGEQINVPLDKDVMDPNDPRIMQKVNNTLNNLNLN